MKNNSRLKGLKCLLFVFMLCLSFVDTEWICADDIRIEHTFPTTMKIGERFAPYSVSYYGLEPYERYAGGTPFCNSGSTVWNTCGGYGGEEGYADENGNILDKHNVDLITCCEGETSVLIDLSRDYEGENEIWIQREIVRIRVEPAIIKNNAPAKVKSGDVIEFKTEILNTACRDIKIIEQKMEELVYTPSVEIIEGKELVTQSSQDYTNSLHTYEKLKFSGSGTVKAKVSYTPTAFSLDEGRYLLLKYGIVEQIVTIKVEEEQIEIDDAQGDDSKETEDKTTQKPTEDKPKDEIKVEESKKEEAYVIPMDHVLISREQFQNVLKENESRDVVIKSDDDIIFTFVKGTMSQVDNMEKYDFGANIETNYEDKGEYGTLVTKDNFVMQVNYNYSGKLPGMASIRITVGADKVGNTLYYSKICDDGTIAFVCSAVVDENGIITVNQDSCSDYILTTERIDDETNTDDVVDLDNVVNSDNVNVQMDNEKEPTANVGGIIAAVVIMIAIIGAIVVVILKKK